MKHLVSGLIILSMAGLSTVLNAAQDDDLQHQIKQLQEQTRTLQAQLTRVQNQLTSPKPKLKSARKTKQSIQKKSNVTNSAAAKPQLNPSMQLTPRFHSSPVSVHSIDLDPESAEFYPTALVANEHVLTYIAGTPIVTSPYLGSRPAFDGSDYIVNISSINRDIRLMQQRRSLERAYNKIGYPIPNKPIIAISGKAEPIGTVGRQYFGKTRANWDLGSSEVDVAAVLNDKVEAYIGIAYDSAPPMFTGQRVANSSFDLNLGFVNIGDLDESPFYFTAGQLYVPFGRFSTSMISAPLTMRLSRIKNRPIIFGYKSQQDTGPFAALYGYVGDTTLGGSGVGGVNVGYILDAFDSSTEVGVSFVSSLNDSAGMQLNGSQPDTTFGGFGSITNGNENVHQVAAVDAHATIRFDRYNITAEWVTSSGRYRFEDLSFNNRGAQPQALQLEGGVTFMSFDRPSSLAASYQWTKDCLALRLPQTRIGAVYNISIWKDTVESIEYHHDIDYGTNQYANGAAPPGVVNINTLGTGGRADMVLAQIGVYF